MEARSKVMHYHPFGMMMPGREYQAQPSRFGFNGKENDNEVKGFGNQQDYGNRIYDNRIARFLSLDPLARNFSWNSPFAFSENDPVNYIDLDGLEKVKPPNIGTKIFRFFTREQHKTRAEQFAANHGIDQSNIFYIDQDVMGGSNGSSVIIYHPVINKETQETILEYKHVFYSSSRSGKWVVTDYDKEELFQPWDLYWDDDGKPIFTNNELSAPIMDAPIGGGPGKAAKGLTLLGGAGKAAKTWSIYQFIDKLNDSKQYFGLTVNYLRRISQHAGRVLKGSELEILQNIPKKDLARGVEQLFIEYGKKVGEISNSINSINPKKIKDYNKLINKAIDYMKKHHNDFDYLWKDRK